MKSPAKTAYIFLLTLLSAWLCVAQQTQPTTPSTSQQTTSQQSAAVVANNVQLVIEGKVINVHDGDTVTVLDATNRKYNIRLQGIDAPELKQAFGSVSQQNLSRLVLGKQVSIYWSKVDKYRRTVGTIMLDGHDMNIEQVKAGMAWHFKKYEEEQEPQDRITYAAAEREARTAKLGLWENPAPTAPGDWRQAVKAKRWGPPPPPGTIIGSRNSKKYHRPDCAGYRDMAEKNRVFFSTVAEAEAAGYKRAGNCPEQENVSVTKTSATIPNVSPAPATTATASPNSVVVPPAPRAKPSVATVQMDSQASLPAETPAANGDGLIIGNKNSKVYHLPGCASYTRVSEKNQVKFASTAEAEKAGYKLAGNCSATKATKP
jgi:endonuclease YncB( thermonuclease family)/methylphosphotriester-DNA--protein-cysteine methyltransferase